MSTHAEAVHKLNRIGRYLLDRHEFAAFDITTKAFASIVNEFIAQMKAARK